MVRASKAAWLDASYGTPKPGRPGTPVSVADGARINDLTITMTRGAVLTGTIRDTAGDPLPNLPVARAVWKPAPDLRTSTEAWLTAGGPHHTVLSTALSPEHLWDFAEMTRTELVMIDADTRPRRFLQELRWNQAYYRLAQGF